MGVDETERIMGKTELGEIRVILNENDSLKRLKMVIFKVLFFSYIYPYLHYSFYNANRKDI